MAPRRYTELFFLDEATALAAGHRPCAFCRRDRYLAFTRAWETAYGGANEGQSLPRTIDAMLHKARIDRQGRKVTHAAACATLPDGTIFLEGEDVRLVWEGKSLGWSFDGYTSGRPVPRGQVEVLTPEPVIAVLKCGYRVQPHDSLGGAT